MPRVISQTDFGSCLDGLACDKASADSRQTVLDCVLHMCAASTVKVSSLFETGKFNRPVQDLALDLAAIRNPRWPLRQQSDVDQTEAAAAQQH